MPGEAAAFVVALLGVAGSGKSIVTRRLIEAHGYQRLRFIDPVRDGLEAMFGLDEAFLDSYQRHRPQAIFGGRTVEEMMTTLSRWGRADVHDSTWCNEWRRRLGGMRGTVVADDVMRDNEAAAVRAAGGIVVRVTRPGWAAKNQIKAARLAAIPHDFELVNHGPQELAEATDEFIAGLASRRLGTAG
jgi:predicted kinase